MGNSEPLQEIIQQYEKGKKDSRKYLYRKFEEKLNKEHTEPLEIVEVDRQGQEEERTVISYQNSFEPQARDMIDTIHQITYTSGKILADDGDLNDLETLEWYLETARNEVENQPSNSTLKQLNISQTLNRVVREIPNMEEMSRKVPSVPDPENYQDYTRHDF